jgi:hypothetical protein
MAQADSNGDSLSDLSEASIVHLKFSLDSSPPKSGEWNVWFE